MFDLYNFIIYLFGSSYLRTSELMDVFILYLYYCLSLLDPEKSLYNVKPLPLILKSEHIYNFKFIIDFTNIIIVFKNLILKKLMVILVNALFDFKAL